MRSRARVHLKASEVSLNNLVVGFVPLAIRPSIPSPLCLASGDAAAVPPPLGERQSEQRQVTEAAGQTAERSQGLKSRREAKELQVIPERLEGNEHQTLPLFLRRALLQCSRVHYWH